MPVNFIVDLIRDVADWLAPEQDRKARPDRELIDEAREAEFYDIPVPTRKGILHGRSTAAAVGGGSTGPHDHEVTVSGDVSRYTDVATWTHTAVIPDNQMRQTGIEVDTSKEFLHIALNLTDDDTAPRELGYQRIRTAEWLALALDDTAEGGAFVESSSRSGILAFPTDDRYNVISTHIRRYQDAQQVNRLAIGFQITADQPSAFINGIRYFYEDKTVTVESTGSSEDSGGGGGGGGALIDVSEEHAPPEINEDNYKNAWADFDRDVPRVWVGYRARHEGTPAEGDFSEFTHAQFLGVRHDDSHAGSPSVFTSYYSLSRHSMRARVRHDGRFGAPDRWVWTDYSYDSWATRMGITLLNWLGERADEAALLREIGDSIDSTRTYGGYNTDTGHVETLDNDTWVDPLDQADVYGAHPLDSPQGFPRSYWWGKGQTERWPTTHPNEDNGTPRRLAWAADGPHENFDGGVGDFILATSDISSDIDAGSPSLTNEMVFQPPRVCGIFVSSCQPAKSRVMLR